MWTRESLKLGAKEQLRGYYWMAFAVSLVYSLVASVGSGISSAFIGMLVAIPVYMVIRVFAKEFFNNYRLVRELTQNIEEE